MVYLYLIRSILILNSSKNQNFQKNIKIILTFSKIQTILKSCTIVHQNYEIREVFT